MAYSCNEEHSLPKKDGTMGEFEGAVVEAKGITWRKNLAKLKKDEAEIEHRCHY